MNKSTRNGSFCNRLWLLLLVVGCSALRAPSANAEQSTPPRPLGVAPLSARQSQANHDESRGKRRDQSNEMTNSIEMKLVLIPDGDYMMGSPGTERGRVRYVEGPRRRVWITEPFYLGVYEVTVGQFRQFVEDANYKTEAEIDGGGWGWNEATWLLEGRNPRYTWRNAGFSQTDAHPVVNVTWNDAVAFCRWLSEVEGEEYRLPTEAEWEYACRAGTTTAYYHGNDPVGLAQVGNVAGVTTKQSPTAEPAGEGCVLTWPVGQFRENEFGLHDMHGNVWEWCADWYDLGYYRRSPEENPTGSPHGSLRVSRGGSWNTGARSCRSASRNAFGPGSRSYDLGFRVVLGPAPSKEADRTREAEPLRGQDARR